MWSSLAALVVASFLIALSPGPGTALVLRHSVRGRRSAVAVVAGAWYLVLVGALDRVRGWLARAGVRRALDRVCGGVLVALGLRLVVDAR